MKDGYTHITFEDRNTIECDLNIRRSLSAIAKKLCERVGFNVGDRVEVAVNPRTHRIELFVPAEPAK